MRTGYTHISILLDRSGSMQSIVNDVIGGFNSFIKAQQKEPGKLTVTLAQFDTDYEVLHQNAEVAAVQPLTEQTFVPRGGTALLKFATKLINDTGATLAAMPESERPEKVLFVMITDGEENASNDSKLNQPLPRTFNSFNAVPLVQELEFTNDKLKALTAHQKEKYNWEFMYIGANQDAFAVGQSLGVTSVNYMATEKGTGQMFAAFSKSMSSYRGAGAGESFNLSDADINNADEKEFLKSK